MIVPLVLIAAVVIGAIIIAVCTRRHRKATGRLKKLFLGKILAGKYLKSFISKFC